MSQEIVNLAARITELQIEVNQLKRTRDAIERQQFRPFTQDAVHTTPRALAESAFMRGLSDLINERSKKLDEVVATMIHECEGQQK